MATAAEPPFLIFQQVAAGYQFTKVDPDAGPQRDGVIHQYPNRIKGGRLLFSNNLFFQIRRILFNFADADSWSIAINHKWSGDVEVAVDSINIASASKQVVNFVVTGGSDGDYAITINGTTYTFNAVSQTEEQIATNLKALLDADTSIVTTILTAPDDDTIRVSSAVAGTAFTHSVSSTGDPISESVISENSGSGPSLQRFDIIRDLAPGETIVVETSGATSSMFVEVMAYPSASNNTQSFG